MLELVLWTVLATVNVGPLAPEQFRPDFYVCPKDHPGVCLADAYQFGATYEAARRSASGSKSTMTKLARRMEVGQRGPRPPDECVRRYRLPSERPVSSAELP